MPSPPEFSSSAGSVDLSSEERHHHLIEWLRSSRKLTTALAAEAFGVSRRTIARDLAHLREAFTLDIDFDTEQGTYVLAEEHTALPFLAFPSLAPVLLNSRLAENTGSSEDAHTISVRFSARAIRAYVSRGGRIPKETFNEDGSLDVHFAPPNLDEFMCYILSRGHHVEVLHPPEFRQRVHMEIRRMLMRYDGETPSSA